MAHAFAPIRANSFAPWCCEERCGARATTRRGHAPWLPRTPRPCSSPRACRSASCWSRAVRSRGPARPRVGRRPPLRPLGELRAALRRRSQERAASGNSRSVCRRIHSIQPAIEPDDDELGEQPREVVDPSGREQEDGHDARARRRRSGAGAGRARAPVARRPRAAPGPAIQAARRTRSPSATCRRNEPRRSSVRMSHALSAPASLSRSAVSSPTRYQPPTFTASSPTSPENEDRDADPADRDAATAAGEPEREPRRPRGSGCGSSQASAFRSRKASCAVSRSSERKSSIRPVSGSIRRSTVSRTPSRSEASRMMSPRSSVTTPSSVVTVPLLSSSTSTSVVWDGSPPRARVAAGAAARAPARRSRARPGAAPPPSARRATRRPPGAGLRAPPRRRRRRRARRSPASRPLAGSRRPRRARLLVSAKTSVSSATRSTHTAKVVRKSRIPATATSRRSPIEAARDRGRTAGSAWRLATPRRRPRRGRRRASARTARSTSSRETRHEILIGEVEISRRLIDSSASDAEHARGDSRVSAHAGADERDLPEVGDLLDLDRPDRLLRRREGAVASRSRPRAAPRTRAPRSRGRRSGGSCRR